MMCAKKKLISPTLPLGALASLKKQMFESSFKKSSDFWLQVNVPSSNPVVQILSKSHLGSLWLPVVSVFHQQK